MEDHISQTCRYRGIDMISPATKTSSALLLPTHYSTSVDSLCSLSLRESKDEMGWVNLLDVGLVSNEQTSSALDAIETTTSSADLNKPSCDNETEHVASYARETVSRRCERGKGVIR